MNENAFIKRNLLDAGANNAYTENGAISYSTMGKVLLDQFGKAGSYMGRDLKDVWNDQSRLWAENPTAGLKFPFYLRLISRNTNILGKSRTEKVQKGGGLRDEAFKRFLWIATYHPDEFYRNLWLIPTVGSWKDLWVMLCYDPKITKNLKLEYFWGVIASGLTDDSHRDLVKKYMPRIRSEKQCHTDWAKRSNEMAKKFAKYAGWTYNEYRHLKSSGTAHDFQKLICSGLYDKINWDNIPGKALLKIVNGNFLENHKLVDKYVDWIKNRPVAKFNGYPFELGMALRTVSGKKEIVSLPTKLTVDAQFNNLIETAKKNNGGISGNVLCAIDTSSSMSHVVKQPNTTAFDVCVSLGIYFSELNTGAFHNTIAMFDNISELKTLRGTFSDKWHDIKGSRTAWGSTNFQSLIDLIVDTRRSHPDIPIEDFPKTLLVVSDMQFNPVGNNVESNYEATIRKMSEVFPKEFLEDFKMIWWYVGGARTTDFPSTMEHGGTYMFSGFDGATISFILGGDTPNTKNGGMPTMEEVIEAAFSQEVLTLVQ